MQIWIRSADKGVECMDIGPMDTVQALKEKIRSILGVPVECQRLTLARQELKNCNVLADYGFKLQTSSLLPAASACGAGKVAQLFRENRTINLQVVPVSLDESAKESGDLAVFIAENAARISYLRARQHLLNDHVSLSTAKVYVPTTPVTTFGGSEGRFHITLPATPRCESIATSRSAFSDSSCASLATRAPSEGDDDSVSLPRSPLSSPCASSGASLEVDALKLEVPSSKSFSLDAFTRDNSEHTTRLLKLLQERREAHRFGVANH